MGCMGLRNSIAVRAMYALGFIIASIFTYIIASKEDWMDKFPFDETCQGRCRIYVTVFRVSLGLVIFHSLMMILVVRISDSRHPRAVIQNGLWPAKIVLWFGPILGCFFIRPAYFYSYWIPALIGSVLFIFLQCVIFVDKAHALSESLTGKYEDESGRTRRRLWQFLLIFMTLVCYICTIAGSAFLYYRYSPGPPENLKGCALNVFFISFNLLMSVIQSIFSIHPNVREHNPSSGLLQAGCLSAYNTYLISSAVVNSPYECVASTFKLSSNDPYVQTVNVMGSIMTIVCIMYAATSSGSNATVIFGESSDQDDEQDSTVYNYSFFHFSFVLAAFNIASVMTNWDTLDSFKQSNNVISGFAGQDLTPILIDKGGAAIWVKVATSWICSLLYLWTLVGK